MSKLVDIIAGARPNFVKIASIIDALRIVQAKSVQIQYRLIHTGQHYDKAMSGDFFEQLNIPHPDVNLEVGSGSPARQAGDIMVGYEKVLAQRKSDLCVVVGDVTSTMACAITAQKMTVPVAHVEAGIRSGDWTMPEEINRLVTDAITNYFFTTSEVANAALRRGGVRDEQMFFVGNTMIDTLLKQRPRFQQPAIWAAAGLQERKYFVLTLHRPANVDQSSKLAALIGEIVRSTRGLPIIFPVHPRTSKNLSEIGSLASNLHITEPLSYLEFNYLMQNAIAVITDSGGITEETTVLGIPCLTLRDTTERPETVTLGTNVLVGTDPAMLPRHMEELFAGRWKKGEVPPLWDGRAGERIIAHLEQLLSLPQTSVPQ